MRNGKKSSPLSILDLPDDVLFNCLALASRLHYPSLSLVSKRFNYLLSTHKFNEFRTLLGCTDNCLYLCLRFKSEDNPRWFTLCKRPTRILKKRTRQTSDNMLVSVPTCDNVSPKCWTTLVAIGSRIYKIGGFINGVRSSKVFFMDCRTHTWHEAPSMLMAKNYPRASVLDGKIYVMESQTSQNSISLIESFDPKTQIWENVPSPSEEIRWNFLSKSLAINGELYLFGDKRLIYKPNENKWDVLGSETRTLGSAIDSFCMIDNIIYRYGGMFGMLQWYDAERRSWRVLKGLKVLTKLLNRCRWVRMVNYGGKIALLWEDSKRNMVWCAEIAPVRGKEQDIYGNINWLDVVLKSSQPYDIVQVIVATI